MLIQVLAQHQAGHHEIGWRQHIARDGVGGAKGGQQVVGGAVASAQQCRLGSIAISGQQTILVGLVVLYAQLVLQFVESDKFHISLVFE